MADLISVIVSTYNRADALDAVLRSLSTQTDREFRDRRRRRWLAPATPAKLLLAGARVPVFRSGTSGMKTRASGSPRSAIARSWRAKAPTAFFSTAIAWRGPVSSRRIARLAQPGWFVTGSRLLLSQALTARVLADGLAPEQWGLGTWIGQRLRGGVNRHRTAAAAVVGRVARSATSAAGAARAAATWRSGAPTSTRSMASMRRSSAGAAKIRICSRA